MPDPTPLFRRLLLASAALAGLLPSVRAQERSASPSEASDRVAINRVVTDGFVHPGIGFTKEILENARAQIIAKRDPWYSGYRRLAANPQSAATISIRNESKASPGKPDVDAYDNKGIENRLKQDAARAKRQALMYVFTGDETHRANALRVIRVWSQMDPKKYKNYGEAHIHASYATQDLIIAAELLRYTDTDNPKLRWTEKDTRDFTDNFALPAVNTFLNGNGWFMNQNGYPLAASMSKDIFTNDRKEYAKRVEWFTVNKTAPNPGWSSSLTHMARLVDTNALTGEKVAEPQVQMMEMGRDQAHGAGDFEIFQNTARQMNAQGTRVDPVTGEISTSENAVGPYEFLDDRILAAADHFCRFMLGYDTHWIPSPSDIGPSGEIRQIYTRIADNYRGRIRGLDFWDMWYHYACVRGADVAKKAPYYHEAFSKRIVASDTDWIFIPANVAGEGARVAPTEQQPAVVEIEQRSTLFDDKATVLAEDGASFVRIVPTEAGARIAVLSCDTAKKTVGLRVRTAGVTEIALSGFAKPWLLPDTQGEWRVVAYAMDGMERFGDIVYFTVKGSPDALVDLDALYRDLDDKQPRVSFEAGDAPLDLVVYASAPVSLNFAAGTGGRAAVIASLDKPYGSEIDPATGAFSWTPKHEETRAFVVTATDDETIAARRVRLTVAPDRDEAVRLVTTLHDKETAYVAATLRKCTNLFNELRRLPAKTKDAVFYPKFMQMQKAFLELEPLTPRLPDGSMDYPKLVKTSDIGESIGLLADGNDDTFPVHYLAKDLNYVFDFGAGFAITANAFELEGRMNFENRAQSAAFFGSNDGKAWTRLTEPLAFAPKEFARLEVNAGLATTPFRYLKVEKTERSGLFEPSELRIHGRRVEAR